MCDGVDGLIYLVTNLVSGKVYVGQTHQLYYKKHPEALKVMAERTAERLRSDPESRRVALAGLERGRAAKAAKRGPWVALEDVRAFATHRTAREYNRDKPPNMPGVGSLLQVFGLTYSEIKHGRRHGRKST